jgi:hypothetical protein
MKPVCLSAALGLAATMFVACAGTNENPTGPTPPVDPSVTVRTVTVSSAVMSATTYQMTARADLSDGTSRDVTTQSKWETSNASIATVSAAGVVTAIGSGQVEVRATFQNVTGSATLTVNAPAPGPSKTFAVFGVARETAPASHPLAGVVIRVTAGPDAGATATSDASGAFRFTALKEGTVAFEGTKDGYLPWQVSNLTLDHDTEVGVLLFPVPPKNDTGTSATARCNDGTWSWAATRAEACTANGGVAYGVCPGPLCNLSTAK